MEQRRRPPRAAPLLLSPCLCVVGPEIVGPMSSLWRKKTRRSQWPFDSHRMAQMERPQRQVDSLDFRGSRSPGGGHTPRRFAGSRVPGREKPIAPSALHATLAESRVHHQAPGKQQHPSWTRCRYRLAATESESHPSQNGRPAGRRAPHNDPSRPPACHCHSMPCFASHHKAAGEGDGCSSLVGRADQRDHAELSCCRAAQQGRTRFHSPTHNYNYSTPPASLRSHHHRAPLPRRPTTLPSPAETKQVPPPGGIADAQP